MNIIQELIDTLTEVQQLQGKFARCVEITPDDVRGWLAGDEAMTVEEGGYPPEPEFELLKDVDDSLLSEAIVIFVQGSDEVNEFMEKAAHVIAKDYINYARSGRDARAWGI
jgi:hypothetical protein